MKALPLPLPLAALVLCAALAAAEEEIERELRKQPELVKEFKGQAADVRKRLKAGAAEFKELPPAKQKLILEKRKEVFERSALGRTVVPLLVTGALAHEEALAHQAKVDAEGPIAVLLRETARVYRALATALDSEAFARMPKTTRECAAATKKTFEAARKVLTQEARKLRATEEYLDEHDPRHEGITDGLDLIAEVGDALAPLASPETPRKDASLAARDAALREHYALFKAWFEMIDEMNEIGHDEDEGDNEGDDGGDHEEGRDDGDEGRGDDDRR